MANEFPPSGQEQPDLDSTSRHQPQIAGDVPASAPTNDAIGASWKKQEASFVLKGQNKAGGPDPNHPHLFHLSEVGANVFEGGGLQGCHEENWPILKDQNAAVYVARLEPGGVREPHWHPSAWEINFVLEGAARWSVVGPKSTQETFSAQRGDVVFAPQGHFHYFENASDTEDLLVLIVFNSSAKEPNDDIGIVQCLKAIPADVLAAVFGGPAERFLDLPGKTARVVIARKK